MMAFQLPGPGPMVVASVHHTGMRKGPWIRAGWLGFSATGLSKSKGDKKKLGQRSSGGEAGRGMGGRRDLPGMVMPGPGRILTEKMTRKMKTIGRIGDQQNDWQDWQDWHSHDWHDQGDGSRPGTGPATAAA